jgi:arginine decarboxylase
MIENVSSQFEGGLIEMIPNKIFFTKGVGSDKKKLQSFEKALRDAGIAQFNLVTVSSILPPHCTELSREEGLKKLKPGQIVFVVMAKNSSKEENRLLSASIGAAKPKDPNSYGYLSEHHAFGQNEKKAGDFSEDLAASMLASTLGIPFDLDSAYDEKKEIFRMSDKIVETKSVTACTAVSEDGVYTTVVSAAVFIIDD